MTFRLKKAPSRAEGKRLVAAIDTPGQLLRSKATADFIGPIDDRPGYKERGPSKSPEKLSKPAEAELHRAALMVLRMEKSPAMSTAKDKRIDDLKSALRLRLHSLYGKPHGYRWPDVQVEFIDRGNEMAPGVKITTP